MTPNEIRYDLMVEHALRNVVEDALKQVEKHGFPGEHHFYITFRTDHPYVDIPESLKKQYPEEMTIVIQYEYEDLHIEDGHIAITLSFEEKDEHIKFPLDAITTFADPAVNFALQFQSFANLDADSEEYDEFALDLIDTKSNDAHEHTAVTKPTPAKPQEAGEVVSLDSFRKKKKKK